MKDKFNMLEPYHVLYVLLAAHLLAVLYSPAIFNEDEQDNLRNSILIQKTPMGDEEGED